MIAAGDVVHYSLDGVCEVSGIVEKKLGEQLRRFYQLHPLYRKNSVIYLPTDNEMLLSRVRPVLTKEEVLTAISEINEVDSVWIDADAARKEVFQQIIRSGEHRQLISLVKTLYERKAVMQEDGRKLRSADSSFLKDAERLINEEFAYVLGIDPGDVPNYIKERIRK
ncbi:MAG: transcriptional regulator [Lachnospiraceae bacterium]|nr:transcriptional regulator [Lachnospiraceae bacterium]